LRNRRSAVAAGEGKRAARSIHIYLNSLCGGEGVCGKCRVQIIKGNAKVDSNSVAFLQKKR
jgi:uncharacterized 2Fe-2S/4Fe-4S cluster protein (DUF4445 family)